MKHHIRMRGVVETILYNKGYGFIRDTDNQQRFFHIRETKDFQHMYVGLRVEFTPTKLKILDGRHNRLRAINVIAKPIVEPELEKKK